MSPDVNKEQLCDELAALLDGELTDFARAEVLRAAIECDCDLRDEFELQRMVKITLTTLQCDDCPSFMATRIMGEIAARRAPRRRGFGVPAWGAAAAAVAIFATGYGIATWVPASQVAEENAGMQVADVTVHPPGLVKDTGKLYQAVATSAVPALPDDTDPWLRSFLELGNQAHAYRKSLHASHGTASPDMGSAVMVVDQGR